MDLKDKARQEAQKVFGGSIHKCVTEQFKAYELGYTHCFEQLDKPVVSGKQPDPKTVQAAAFDYATKMSTAPDKETPDWIIQDFKAGAQWALSQVACASGAVDKTVCDGLNDCKQGHPYVRCDCKGDCEF